MKDYRLPIEIHDLTVSYQKRPVLYGVDLEIEEGSLVGVLGPNGAGKSTLIKAVMDMIKPNGGYVKIFGKVRGRESNELDIFHKENPLTGIFP